MSDEIVRGGDIVRRLRDGGVPLEGAFWRHDPDEDSWRLILASTEVQTGLTGLSVRAARLLPPSDLFDIVFVAPEDRLFQAVKKARGAVQSAGRRIRNTLIDGRYIDDAFVYTL